MTCVGLRAVAMQVRQADLSNKLLLQGALSDALQARLAPALADLVTRGEETAAAVEVANEQLLNLRMNGEMQRCMPYASMRAWGVCR